MDNNAVLISTHNLLDLTKQCVESVLSQDIPMALAVIDNVSSDGTREWIAEQGIDHIFNDEDYGLTYSWNKGLHEMWSRGYERCLVLNNDTMIPDFFYRRLIETGKDFVTGMEVTAMDDIGKDSRATMFFPNPQFSAFMISKNAFEMIGDFDSRFWGWCNDCDYHLRSHRKGVPMWSTNVYYYHERSSTIKTAPPKEKSWMKLRADADRLAFYEKHGFEVGSQAYHDAFSPETFGAESNHVETKTIKI